ncbi:MAG: type II toxin-antitoxin system RelE/ParE family toxin [Gammaproteobacteria bacterium]
MLKPKPILAVKFFMTAAGKEPAREFLQKLTQEERKIIGTDIKEVQFGWPLGMPLVRKMEPDLWEVRSSLDDRIVRSLFTLVGSEMVLLHIFLKKSQQTPKGELETARKRLKELRGGSNG